MKAVWLEDKQLSLRDVPIPQPKPGEVLVKVIRSGICNTDLELEKGYYPYTGVLGHEFVGRVVDEHAPDTLKDQIVVGEINCVCNKCKFCESGLKNHCSDRTVMGIVNRWGCHAEYVCLPTQNLLVAPEIIPVKDLCFVEPIAAALEIQEQVSIKADDRIAVIGDGKLGLLIAKTLRPVCTNLRVYGHHQEKLDILKIDNIETCLCVDSNDFGGFDVIVECTGNKDALQQAVNLLRPRGTLVLKSTHHGATEINMAPIVVNEITLIGSRCGPFDKALKFLEQGSIKLDGMLDSEFPMDQAMLAFDHAKKRNALKVQLVMSE